MNRSRSTADRDPSTSDQRSARRIRWCLLSLVFLLYLGAVGPVAQLPADPLLELQEFREHRGRNRLLFVFATDRNEDRVFEFHLALSMAWDAVERRRIVPVDILPGRRDLDAVARILGIEGRDFAVVLLSREGEVLFRTDDAGSLAEILARVDLHVEGVPD